jgi:hypothetical protein
MCQFSRMITNRLYCEVFARGREEARAEGAAHVSERSDALRDAERLGAQAHHVAAAFLLTEVNTGLSLLDAIDASADRAADERRGGLAVEAYLERRRQIGAGLRRPNDEPPAACREPR